MRSRIIDLDGPVHVADFGGEGPALMLVHGLGGSHANWLAVGPRLAARARVVALDLPGFGRTPLEGRSPGAGASTRLLARFIETEMRGPAVLVGNSMGGMLSLATASRNAELVAGLVLVDPALPRTRGAMIDPVVATSFAAYATPGVGEMLMRRRAARLGAEGIVRETLALCCVDPSRVPPEIVEALVALARDRIDSMPWANTAFLGAARSLMRTLAWRPRFDAIVRSISAPTLIVHGARDRLVPLAAVEALVQTRRDWALEIYDDIGHVPQLEASERFVASVLDWLHGAGKAAAVAAMPTS